ncbi:unnamed protein product [Microthlaspi erraticum]|uniref:Glutathione S-transferase n=1 Tax=Microthlaspi erraticum TaxID=1685480 RepID=A0A6D2K6H4_9BRAS|nr:unnamed protein product [Microthlaspi erraticum]
MSSHQRLWKHNPVLPQDPYERSKARFLGKLVDEKINGNGYVSTVKQDEKGYDVVIVQTRDLITHLEKELAGKNYFGVGGKSFAFGDIVIGSLIPFCAERAWEAMGLEVVPEHKFPEYTRWVKNLEKVEFIKDCIPPREKHVEHMKFMGGRIGSGHPNFM